MTSLSPAGDTALHQADAEVRLLVEAVRLSRATLLHADPGPTTRVFLRSTFLPLLRDEADGGSRSLPVLFDGWNEDPLEALNRFIESVAGLTDAEARGSLAARLRTFEERLDASFVIVFDRFDAFLGSPDDSEAVARFEEELIEAITDMPQLRTSFVFVVPAGGAWLESRVLRRIPGLGEASLPVEPAAGMVHEEVSEVARFPAPNVGFGDAPVAHASRGRMAVPKPRHKMSLRPLHAALAAIALVLAGALHLVIPGPARTGDAARTAAAQAPKGLPQAPSNVVHAPQEAPAATLAGAEPGPPPAAGAPEMAAPLPSALPAPTPATRAGGEALSHREAIPRSVERTAGSTPPRRAAATAPRPAPHVERTIDVAYGLRVRDECAPGLAGFICREAIRFELCGTRWSSTQTNGRSICHVAEAAAPLGD
jgi:hypothetical protein